MPILATKSTMYSARSTLPLRIAHIMSINEETHAFDLYIVKTIITIESNMHGSIICRFIGPMQSLQSLTSDIS